MALRPAQAGNTARKRPLEKAGALPGGVEAVLRSLAQVLDCGGDPLEIVHPETAALYRRLTVSRPPHT